MPKKKRSIGQIRKLGDNKYLLRLSLGYDDFGKRIQPSKQVECSSEREAERLLLEFYNERESLKIHHSTGAPKTLGELYSEWFQNHVKQNLAPQTIEWYEGLWHTNLEYASKIHLDVLAPAHIHKILQGIEKERTKNAVFKMLKAMLNKGVKWGYITRNVCNMLETPKYEAEEKSTLSSKQLSEIVTYIKDEELKYQAMYYFAVLCSLRRQEIIGLKWSRINFDENTFSVKQAAIQVRGQGTSASKTKTKKSARTLHLPDMLKGILIRLKKEQNIQRMKCGDLWNDEDWVFTQWNGKIMSLQTPSHWWKDFKERNSIETDVTFHGLRHTAATHMIKNNVPLSTVSGVLGHAKISTTANIYVHVIEDTKKDAINVMESLIKPAETDSKQDII